MVDINETLPNYFFLLGLSVAPSTQICLVIVFMLMYMITLSGNLLLVIVVQVNPVLQTPMYFFLSNLSVNDVCFSSNVLPKILNSALSEDTSISMLGCAAQMYFSSSLGACECIILAVMAYDRFVAICRPLYYNTIMRMKSCVIMAAGSWATGLGVSAFIVTLIFHLPYCGSYQVNHFFCEIVPFLQMSCGDTFQIQIVIYIAAGIIVMCSFFLILTSYIHIISTILKIQSSNGRHKTFSTCVSHLTVVILYYGTVMFMYLRPHSKGMHAIDKVVAIVYTGVTPMLNPFIYSMRNKDVKSSVICRFNRM